VIEAANADVSTVLFALAASSAAQSPLEDIPVLTTVTDPGLVAYWVSLPLSTQLPPARPSV